MRKQICKLLSDIGFKITLDLGKKVVNFLGLHDYSNSDNSNTTIQIRTTEIPIIQISTTQIPTIQIPTTQTLTIQISTIQTPKIQVLKI